MHHRDTLFGGVTRLLLLIVNNPIIMTASLLLFQYQNNYQSIVMSLGFYVEKVVLWSFSYSTIYRIMRKDYIVVKSSIHFVPS